jgi:hypothetical protein
VNGQQPGGGRCAQESSKLSPISTSSKRANRSISLGNYPTRPVCQRGKPALQDRESILAAPRFGDPGPAPQYVAGKAQGAARYGPAASHFMKRSGRAQLACQQQQLAGPMAPRERHARHARGAVAPSPRPMHPTGLVAARNLRVARQPAPISRHRRRLQALVIAVCWNPPEPRQVLASHVASPDHV